MRGYESTKERYYSIDRYSESRIVEVHNRIIESFLEEGINPTNPPEAILLGGGSASGKSTISDFFIDGYNQKEIPIVLVDCDEIKLCIPEYKAKRKLDPENAAKYVHDESSDISIKLLKRCVSEGRNLIYDGTMKNKEKYLDIIKILKEKAFKITIVVVDVPVKIAKERNDIRFSETGRLVPIEELEKSHEEVPKVFMQLKDEVDEYLLIDMRGDVEPFEYIATKVDGNESIYNPKKLEEFIQKASLTGELGIEY